MKNDNNEPVIYKIREVLTDLYSDSGKRLISFSVIGLIINMVFAVFNGYVGLASRSSWYGTMCAYFLTLFFIRMYIVLHKDHKSESIYRSTGIALLFIELVHSGALALLVQARGGRSYPGVTIYMVSAYTFYKLIVSIINVLKAGKQDKAYILALRKISNVEALLSLLSLQAALFFSFGDPTSPFSKLFNLITGGVIWCTILGIAIETLSTRKKRK